VQSKGNVIFSGLKRLIGFGILFSKDAVYCISFVLFDSQASRDNTFVSIPLNDWSNIHSYIKRHEVLRSHIAIASQQTATHFLDIMSKKSKTESIISILLSHRKEDIARNKHIVKEIIEVLILYGRQNIAILEHNKDKCNSMAICVMCPNTTKYYSITWITQSLIRSNNKIHISRYTEQDNRNCGEMVR
jgi:hypothetical protein